MVVYIKILHYKLTPAHNRNKQKSVNNFTMGKMQPNHDGDIVLRWHQPVLGKPENEKDENDLEDDYRLP